MSFAQAITTLLNEGRSVTLRRKTRTTYNPTTDSYSTNSSADTTVTAVLLAINARLVNGVSIMAGDKTALLQASVSPAPQPDDQIIDGSVTYRIVAVKTVKPGADVVGYSAQLRQGAN